MRKQNNAGFSLVEMAVVLVIIGLITVAVLYSVSLVKSASLRTTISDIQRFKTAIRAFVLQYEALPGDMTDAREYWPNNFFFSGFRTENGNGNGLIETVNGEDMRAWQHLNAGEFLGGNYTGELENGIRISVGVNVPESEVSGGGYHFAYVEDYYERSGNAIKLASEDLADTLRGSVLNTPDAVSLDKKMDDGLAASGEVITMDGYGEAGCLNTLVTPYIYEKSNTDVKCYMLFWVRN